MQTIKLLQVIPALDSGGVEQGTVDIAQGVVKKSGSSLVVSNGGRLVPRLKRCGSEHIELSPPQTPHSSFSKPPPHMPAQS